MTTADGNESICNAGHESVIAMAATGSARRRFCGTTVETPAAPSTPGDINAIEATASATSSAGT